MKEQTDKQKLLLQCKEIQKDYPEDNLHYNKIQIQINKLEEEIRKGK